MREKYCAWVAALVMAGGCGAGGDPNAIARQVADLRVNSEHRLLDLVTEVKLVSDQPGTPRIDTRLRNAWGLAFAPAGRAWVSSNGRGIVQVYNSVGRNLLTEPVPSPTDPVSKPTGQVFNPFTPAFRGDLFLVATEEGTIAGWNGGTSFKTEVDTNKKDDIHKDPAVYKGLAVNSKYLYAADFHNGNVDVFDTDFHQLPCDGRRFVDPGIPEHFAPFNVKAEGELVFVTYAKQLAPDFDDDEAGPGNGFVDVWDADGDTFVRLVSNDALNSPWGLAFALSRSDLSLRMMVGNFGDGRINVYRINLGDELRLEVHSEGPLVDPFRRTLIIPGLWDLEFGTGTGGFAADQLFFTAGPNHEMDGLFGRLVFARP